MLKQSSKTKTQQTSNKAGETSSSFPFRNIVGGIAWLTHTRPDIAMAVANVQRRQQNPSQEDECLVKHILRYLRGTTQKGLPSTKTTKYLCLRHVIPISLPHAHVRAISFSEQGPQSLQKRIYKNSLRSIPLRQNTTPQPPAHRD